MKAYEIYSQLIYEINPRLAALVDPDTGELLDLETFEQLQLDKDEKIEGMVLWYKNLCAESAAVKEEADKLAARAKALSLRAERMKSYIGNILTGEKFSTSRCTVSFRASSSVDVSDQTKLIEWAEQTGHKSCLKYKPPEVSKSAVAELLKQGVEVPFAAIKTKKNVLIR